MYANSRPVASNQHAVNRNLRRLVLRHLSTPFRRPVAPHNEAAFAQADEAWRQHRGALILDSGCGNGESTRRLALHHPQALVVGVDKSAHRLGSSAARHCPAPGNCLLVRADLIDFWRLALDAGWVLARHYLLYPNPWPKRRHLGRRWCAHPVFPVLLALGGRLEVRSNWEIYVHEFAQATAIATGRPAATEKLPPRPPLTPFEAKYRASGHHLFRCIFQPGGAAADPVARAPA